MIHINTKIYLKEKEHINNTILFLLKNLHFVRTLKPLRQNGQNVNYHHHLVTCTTNNLLSPNIYTFLGTLDILWVIVIEHSFYQSFMGTETP